MRHFESFGATIAGTETYLLAFPKTKQYKVNAQIIGTCGLHMRRFLPGRALLCSIEHAAIWHARLERW
jgi:hypothetical protein